MANRLSLRLSSLSLFVGLVGAAGACSQAIGGSDSSGTQPPGNVDNGDDAGVTPTDDSGAIADDTGSNPTSNPTTNPSDQDSGTTPPPPPQDSGTPPPPPPQDSGTTPPPDSGSTTPPGDLARDLNITEIAVFQAVKIDVAKGGSKVSTRSAQVVAGRDGLLRVYVSPGASWSTRSVSATLTLTTGGVAKTVTDTKTISTASTEASLSSTLDFYFSGADVDTTTTYAVALHTTGQTTGSTTGSVYPASGSEALGAQTTGLALKIELVPVAYKSDGSGRLPDTSASQVAIYKQRMMELYPARDVQITVRAPYSYASSITASGSSSWSNVLNAIISLRASDHVADDVYYFGAFEPSSSFNTFCQSGCIAGLSPVAGSGDPTSRASVGLGYTGTDSAETMAHEVGHAHGRSHVATTATVANCQLPSGNDTKYPYSQGLIGSWGYDLTSKALVNPAQYGDMMGYCDTSWISDYTYNGLFQRMTQVASGDASYVTSPNTPPTVYRFLTVHEDGSMEWGDEIVLERKPMGESHDVHFEDETRSEVFTGKAALYGYGGDIGGGFMLVPMPSVPFRAVRVDDLAIAAVPRIERTW